MLWTIGFHYFLEQNLCDLIILNKLGFKYFCFLCPYTHRHLCTLVSWFNLAIAILIPSFGHQNENVSKLLPQHDITARHVLIHNDNMFTTYLSTRCSANFWARYVFPVPLGPQRMILRCSIRREMYLWTIDFGINVSNARESTLFCLVPETPCKISD